MAPKSVPASSSSTDREWSCDNRAASAPPAEPAPTITTSAPVVSAWCPGCRVLTVVTILLRLCTSGLEKLVGTAIWLIFLDVVLVEMHTSGQFSYLNPSLYVLGLW